MRISDRGSNVAYVIQPAESARNVRTLRFLHFIKQLAYIGRHRAHAQTVQRAVQHVCLNTGFMERLRPLPHSLIGVFTKQKINLFKTAAICFYASKTTHFNNGWMNRTSLWGMP